jgi:hypothetical protein
MGRLLYIHTRIGLGNGGGRTTGTLPDIKLKIEVALAKKSVKLKAFPLVKRPQTCSSH